ncbi:MAG: CDP-glycerol glycerophosphotransferase family protein, partial [Firmicutes bacterium]|nr:CDP-glycerol glycerophosphotransferase family protein [Bacillota bacterium]
MAKRNYSSKRSTGSKIRRAMKRPIKKVFGFINPRIPAVKRFYRNMKLHRRASRFNKYAKLPVEKNVIIFESFMGRKYADSPKAIYEYMLNSPEYSEYKFIWSFKDRCMDEYLFLEKNDRTKLILWGSPEYYKAFATAGYWISNSRINKMFAIRPEQVYVQCWHGTPLKRIGFDIEVAAEDARNSTEVVRDVYENDARRYTYMISPSRYCTEKFVSAFNLRNIGK